MIWEGKLKKNVGVLDIWKAEWIAKTKCLDVRLDKYTKHL